MAQGSGDMAGALRNDDRAIVGLLRAIEGAMPGCPVDMAIKAKDGAERRFRGSLQSVTLQGLLFRAAAPHHLPEIWIGDAITIWVGPSMYRLHGRIRPALGTDIAIEWQGTFLAHHRRPAGLESSHLRAREPLVQGLPLAEDVGVHVHPVDR